LSVFSKCLTAESLTVASVFKHMTSTFNRMVVSSNLTRPTNLFSDLGWNETGPLDTR
jgi:hypothetical protein